jgi:hypothetical protein
MDSCILCQPTLRLWYLHSQLWVSVRVCGRNLLAAVPLPVHYQSVFNLHKNANYYCNIIMVYFSFKFAIYQFKNLLLLYNFPIIIVETNPGPGVVISRWPFPPSAPGKCFDFTAVVHFLIVYYSTTIVSLEMLPPPPKKQPQHSREVIKFYLSDFSWCILLIVAADWSIDPWPRRTVDDWMMCRHYEMLTGLYLSYGHEKR